MNTSHHSADVIVIGSGPSGLAFCRSLADSGLRIALIDPHTREALKNPAVDGREVSIIRKTENILTRLGAWQIIPEEEKYPLKSAKVINGDSPYPLTFDTPNNERGLLGYFVPNHHIRKVLFATIEHQENIDFFYEHTVERVHTIETDGHVTLSNGSTITAPLVVSADSRYSTLRKTMGVPTQIKDFGRSVIIFRMRHSLSNQFIATECFHYGRTMAVLPLGEYESSIVITIDSSRAQEIEELNEQQTCADVMEQLDGTLGTMQLISEKHHYPLFGVHAEKFYATRYALIGDTAVGMHPVTAQGFNLGMQSMSLLADLLIKAHQNGEDIGNTALLQRYNKSHMRTTLPLYYGTNALVKLFTNDSPAIKPLRHAVLRLGNHCAPFKYLVNKRLSGS